MINDLTRDPEEWCDGASIPRTLQPIPNIRSTEILPAQRKSSPSLPKSRARLPYDQAGPSSSDFIDARSTRDNDLYPKHSGGGHGHESTTADKSVAARSPSITGTNAREESQSSAQPSDRRDIAPSQTDLPGLAVLGQKKWNKNDYIHLLSGGYILEELLAKSSDSFYNRINSEECRTKMTANLDYHLSLPCARLEVSRVTKKRKKQQEKLLEWLEIEIFTPGTGHPVLGVAPRPSLSWNSNDPQLIYGEIQLELLKYFSEKRTDPIDSTSLLLEKYLAEHTREYLALYQSSSATLEYPTQLSKNKSFRKILAYISNVAKDVILNDIPGDGNEKTGIRNNPLLSPYLEQFEEAFHESETETKQNVRSYYPGVPICICFEKNQPDIKPLRMVNVGKGSLLDIRIAGPRFRRLVVSLDRLHIRYLKMLKVEGRTLPRRGSLIQFLYDSIIEPKDSLPLVGSLEVRDGLAPWFKDLTDENMVDIPVFILAAWYHDKPPYKKVSTPA
ncbi:uncharacterized protein PGTG_04992 [Puccinia graminis f. sp. tritici CRL 75-36-700-3]|uniref:Uncharacterized protein n=1 Tax=Puccinia graminis f. sp. tritici (strain CRL 75-36-700-3 / race SCCL) TaxID=418459 RepID=E3K3H9_PUCGT|nr:uncharacterized protein PGTG_04992 [Puccinia graminis f. sp. tritici CRL 75-36-700-3]EFP79036.2 hypothetical protein PGTG_04992 [Puccinia graminis f. sp. tritici CRL 75-36-700-3]